MSGKRIRLWLLAVAALAAGVAPAAPVPKELRQAVPRLDETTWSGDTFVGQGNLAETITYTFEKDGSITYVYAKTNARYTTATWKQDGKSIYMEFNDKYAEYTGEIKGDVMEGKAVNVKGLEWTWKVTRNKPDKEK